MAVAVGGEWNAAATAAAVVAAMLRGAVAFSTALMFLYTISGCRLRLLPLCRGRSRDLQDRSLSLGLWHGRNLQIKERECQQNEMVDAPLQSPLTGCRPMTWVVRQ